MLVRNRAGHRKALGSVVATTGSLHGGQTLHPLTSFFLPSDKKMVSSTKPSQGDVTYRHITCIIGAEQI